MAVLVSRSLKVNIPVSKNTLGCADEVHKTTERTRSRGTAHASGVCAHTGARSRTYVKMESEQ